MIIFKKILHITDKSLTTILVITSKNRCTSKFEVQNFLLALKQWVQLKHN